MSRPWKRWKSSGLERELLANRPEPPDDFLHALASRIRGGRAPAFGRARLVLVGALSAALLVALSAFGGLGYASGGGKKFASAVESVFTSSSDPGRRGGDDDDNGGGEDDDDDASDDEYKKKKITICHHTGSGRTVTIRISESAWPAHQSHGDTRGACPNNDNDD